MAGRSALTATVSFPCFYLMFFQLSSLGLCVLEGELSLHVPDQPGCLAPCVCLCVVVLKAQRLQSLITVTVNHVLHMSASTHWEKKTTLQICVYSCPCYAQHFESG